MIILKQEKLPFAILPIPFLRKIAIPFYGIGNLLSSLFPFLELELKQSELNYKPREYSSIAFVLSLFYLFLVWLIVYALFYRFSFMDFSQAEELIFSFILAFVFSLLIFSQFIAYPKIIVKRRVREIERNIVFGLRTLLIQLRSGVSLFKALNVIAVGNFGELSRVFKEAVDKINTGYPEEEALQELASKTPSLFFRRSLWQIVNGLKAGGESSEILKEIVSTVIEQQIIEIKAYGSKLRMLSLIYMMLGVVIPALGITFLIVLMSFPEINVTQIMFWELLAVIIVAQFMYLGGMKSVRPSLIEIR